MTKLKTIHHKFGLKDEIKNHQNFNKRTKEKKIQIERIRTKLNKTIYQKL
jgi:ribosomal protein S2